MAEKLYKDLKGVTDEKGVEHAYHNALNSVFKHYKTTPIVTNYEGVKTDGLMDISVEQLDESVSMVRLLMEFKHNNKKLDLTNATDKAVVMCQVVHYIRDLYMRGVTNHVKVVLVGNERYCFVTGADFLYDYIKNDAYDWTLRPSSAGNDRVLRDALRADENLKSVYIRKIDAKFKFNEVKESILKVAQSSSNKLDFPINSEVLDTVFDYFSKKVLKHSADGKVPYTAHEQRNMFMSFVTDNDKCYMNPKSTKLARIGKYNDVKVVEDAFLGLKNNYSFEFNKEERDLFAETADQFLEDTTRRTEGAFFTPSAWVNEAYKTIEEELGVDWTNKYIVWDNSCGTCNLTKGKVFEELYCSTLDEGELELGKNCNPEAKGKFVYDFLNADVESFRMCTGLGVELDDKTVYTSELYRKCPELVNSLRKGDKPLLFFMNPPYATASNLKNVTDSGVSKTTVGKTEINKQMITDKIGACSQNLYAQFLYRCVELGKAFNVDVHIACFTPPLYMSGSSYKGLRKYLVSNEYGVDASFLFRANEFADVSDNWGISFSVLGKGDTEFIRCETKIKELEAFNVLTVGSKQIYNLDDAISGSTWKKPSVAVTKTPYITLKSAVNVDYANKYGVQSCEGSMGYYYDKSNIVEKNGIQVYLLSAPSSDAHGTYIMEENFTRIVSNFTARKLIAGKYSTWVNSKDEYRVPMVCDEGYDATDEEIALYKQWERDCLVYSIFDNSSYQASLRRIDFKGSMYYEVPNHFFFMTKKEYEEMLWGTKVANDCLNEVTRDFYMYKADRYMATQLEEQYDGLSEDAKGVLDLAKEIVAKTIVYRSDFNDDEPRYHINAWDAGWYQIKALAKVYAPTELKEFTEKFKAFGDRLRPLVYELGFLEEVHLD